MNQRWRPVVGSEGFYEVSDHGAVRSIGRIVNHPSGNYFQSGRVLRAGTNRSGHQLVVLSVNGRKTSRLVHQIVLEAFVGPRPTGMEVCHTNGDPVDNRLENLRWGSRSENLRDAVKHGTHHWSARTHCLRGHEYTPENTYIGHQKHGRRCKRCIRDKQHRYLDDHRELRQQLIREMRSLDPCARCGEALIPTPFRRSSGRYQVPPGWIAKNIHLDHQDGSDTNYNGLVHASCNIKARWRQR